MYPSTHSRERSAVPRWQVGVSFFLVFFLLYNPYLAAPSSTSGLNVCHPASNRATVGAAELQHFASAAGQDFPGLDLAPAEVPFPLPAVSGLIFFRVFQGIYPPQQLLCASLWFRPPPAF